MKLRIYLFEQEAELFYPAIDSRGLSVHRSEEAVSYFRDHPIEAEEEVTFKVLVEHIKG